MSFVHRVGSCLMLIALPACASGEEWNGALPAPDYAEFEASVYPVLLRDCAFSECHGGKQRFFHVYGPGRVRLDPMLDPADPATPDEVRASYQRTVSMLATDGDVQRSLLLTKPLEAAVGGQGHKGTDTLGRNVYRSASDPSYQALKAWGMRAAGQAQGSP
jgi:hypothetical protein